MLPKLSGNQNKQLVPIIIIIIINILQRFASYSSLIVQTTDYLEKEKERFLAT